MKPEQIEKQVTWLDEQRRKDSESITSLKDRLSAFEDSVKMLENQIRNLSSDVARLSAQAAQIQQFNDALTKQREDFFRQLASQNDAHAKREKHLETLRKKDYEEITKSMAEFREEIGRIEEFEQSIDTRKHEELRIVRSMDEVEKRLESLELSEEGQSRTLLSMDEARKIDTKRIVELHTELDSLRLRLDTLQGGQDAGEDRIRRNESRLSELAANESIRTEAQNIWMEKQELRLLAFEKEWKNWQKRFEAFEQQANGVDERLLRYDENYRSMKQTREELSQMLERLERRIKEVSEMHRISEDRMRQEWTNFHADDQKRWNTYKLTSDEQWRDHQRMHEKSREEMDLIQENLADSMTAIDRISKADLRRIMDLFAAVKEWAAEAEAASKKK
jgi:chromosome segregation ATPase